MAKLKRNFGRSEENRVDANSVKEFSSLPGRCVIFWFIICCSLSFSYFEDMRKEISRAGWTMRTENYLFLKRFFLAYFSCASYHCLRITKASHEMLSAGWKEAEQEEKHFSRERRKISFENLFPLFLFMSCSWGWSGDQDAEGLHLPRLRFQLIVFQLLEIYF